MVPEIPETVQQLARWVIALTAICGGLYGAWRFVRPRLIVPVREEWKRVSQALTDVSVLKADVAKVKSEVSANGGKTVKDSVLRIEASLELTHGKLTAIIDTATQPIMQADAAGRCTDVNRSFEVLTGYSRPELLAWGWVGVIHTLDRDTVMDDWKEAVKHGRFFSHDFRFVTRDRQVVPVRVLAKPMPSTTGQVMGWHSVVERIGEGIG